MSIVAGEAVSFSLTLRVGGAPVSIPADAVVTATLLVDDDPVTPEVVLSPVAIGARWAEGVVLVAFTAEQTAGLVAGSTVMLRITAGVAGGGGDQSWLVALAVAAAGAGRSALFVRTRDLPSFRTGRLATLCCSTGIDPSKLDDDFLWEMMVEGEAQLAVALGIDLQPTEYFPVVPPTPDEIVALAGRPWKVEPGYDCTPNFFSASSWGTTKLRTKLVTAIHRVQVVYPPQPQPIFTVPPSWVLFDAPGSVLQIIPGGSGASEVPLSVFVLQTLTSGYTVPHMLRVRYTAGLTPEHEFYQLIRGLALRQGAVRVLMNSFIPQSGSISADGLSQSASMDVSKYQDALDAEIESLHQRLKGPIWGVL